jgi:photosystem II stability/assembly factor-like uncharacterized protein
LLCATLTGCGGGGDCPALSVGMQSLAAQAAALDVAVYDSSTSCDGNDVVAGAPAPLVSRHVDGHGDTTLQLPAGHYVVVLHAFDAAGAFIGSACQAELFTPGQRACVSVALSTPMIDGDGGIPDLANGGGGSGGSGVGDMATIPFTAQTSGVTTVLYQPWSPGSGIAYVAGAFGVMLKTTNSGATWAKQTTGTGQDIEAVWGPTSTDVYAVGLKGTVLHTTNGGQSWSTISLGATPSLYDIWGSSASDIYIVGDRVVYHGSGTTFTSLATPSGMNVVNCVWGSSATDVYMLGGNGLVMHGSAAAGFTKMPAPTADTFYSGWGTAQEMWAPSTNQMGTSFTLWHTTDHGATWQSQLTTATPLWATWSTTGADAFTVGSEILESTDHGAHWNPVAMSPAVLQGVGGAPGGTDVYAVGFNGIILHRSQ